MTSKHFNVSDDDEDMDDPNQAQRVELMQNKFLQKKGGIEGMLKTSKVNDRQSKAAV